jgi:Flp pilus assembly protein TadD
VKAKLLYGSALWSLEHPVSAERQFEAAAKLAPHDPVARTAAAVGMYTKADPVKAFSHLGPLTGVFPRAAVVRFHLGLLLLWSGQRQKAVEQLRLAAAEEPGSSYAQDARRLLSRLPGTRSK